MIKKVLIVGGGTAGWLAALTVRKFFPQVSVRLIESEEIGILGAGESTTGDFRRLLDLLDINNQLFIKHTESTIKAAVRFDGWNSPESLFLSNFMPWIGNHIIKPNDNETAEYLLYCYVKNIDSRDMGFNSVLLNNKIPISKISAGEHFGAKAIGGYTLHINAKLAAKYLREIAESRGIIRHEGKIVKINGHYPIKSVQDDKGNVYDADLFFDCTGFARLIIGKHFNTKWKDYTKHLTVDATIPFFLPLEKEYPAYTHAIAMKYGWMFRVPTQKRYGSGYIYNSNLISKEQAIKEVEEKLGHPVELVNFFQFKSGYYEESFVSNCISFGLSSGFIEPMAATNLAVVCKMLFGICELKDINALLYGKTSHITYNKIYLNEVEGPAMTETFSHYVNDRTDTEFWMHYKNIENYPTIFRKAYEECFSGDKFEFGQFSEMTGFERNTFMTKLIGNCWFKEKAIKYFEKNNLEKKYKFKHIEHSNYVKNIMHTLFDHREYLEKWLGETRGEERKK